MNNKDFIIAIEHVLVDDLAHQMKQAIIDRIGECGRYRSSYQRLRSTYGCWWCWISIYKKIRGINMERITSFSVDHTKLTKGVYVSRIDGELTTFDIRMTTPNLEPALNPSNCSYN